MSGIDGGRFNKKNGEKVVYTYFKKRVETRMTYKNNTINTNVLFAMQKVQPEMYCSYKVMASENLARHHRIINCSMTTESKSTKRVQAEQRIK